MMHASFALRGILPCASSGDPAARGPGRPLMPIAAALAVLCINGWPATGHAHPVSLSYTHVYVSREQASVRIDLFLEDLFLFHNLQPDDADYLDAETLRRGIELHKEFVARRFVIQDVEGRSLRPQRPPTVEAEIPPEGVPLAELMKHRLTFEMQYAFESPPEFLTFKQRFVNEDDVLPSEMHLQVRQENAPVMFIQTLLPNVPHSVRFSWTHPPLSADASVEEWEQWVEQQQEETLGISSYSSVYSFLYIEDYEVRHEILIPLLILEQSLRIKRDDDDFLDVDEQQAARTDIEEFFKSGNPIEVDGQRCEPIVQRCDFYGLDFKDFARQANSKPVSLSSARVGIILSYSLDESPGQVRLTWDRFNDSLWAVSTVVFAFDDVSRTTLARIGGNNVFDWQSAERQQAPSPKQVPASTPPVSMIDVPILSLGIFLAVPMLLVKMKRRSTRPVVVRTTTVLLLAAAICSLRMPLASVQLPLGRAPAMSKEQADAIFGRVHANTYDAFRYRTEGDIYDALQVSTDRELLRDIYLQVQSGLKMQEQGGAVSRIRQVEIVEGQHRPLRTTPGFSYHCRWNVSGTVEHWGHVHERTNQYEAMFRVEPVDNAWKLTRIELLDEQRLEFQTRLRKL